MSQKNWLVVIMCCLIFVSNFIEIMLIRLQFLQKNCSFFGAELQIFVDEAVFDVRVSSGE